MIGNQPYSHDKNPAARSSRANGRCPARDRFALDFVPAVVVCAHVVHVPVAVPRVSRAPVRDVHGHDGSGRFSLRFHRPGRSSRRRVHRLVRSAAAHASSRPGSASHAEPGCAPRTRDAASRHGGRLPPSRRPPPRRAETRLSPPDPAQAGLPNTPNLRKRRRLDKRWVFSREEASSRCDPGR
jgi:hypothetical protein